MNPTVGGRLTRDRAPLLDAVRIGADALLGLVGAALLFATPTPRGAVMLGARAAILPDPLQFVHAHFPREPFGSIQRFRRWRHKKKPMRRAIASRIVSQKLVIVVVVVLAKADDPWGAIDARGAREALRILVYRGAQEFRDFSHRTVIAGSLF